MLSTLLADAGQKWSEVSKLLEDCGQRRAPPLERFLKALRSARQTKVFITDTLTDAQHTNVLLYHIWTLISTLFLLLLPIDFNERGR